MTVLPLTTIPDLIGRQCDIRPDAPALVWLPDGRADDEPLSYTYAEMATRIRRLANLLRAHCVTQERPVTLLLPNLADTHLLLWAGATAGTVSPINPFLSAGQIAGIMRESGSRSVVAPPCALEPEMARKAREVAALLGGVQAFFVAGPAEPDAIPLSAADAWPGDRLAFDRVVQPDDVAALLHTGGTTGVPKLVRQTHRNQASVAALGPLLMGLEPGDVVLTGLPLFHTNATIVTGLSVFAAGGTVLLAGRHGFRSRDTVAEFWRIVERFRITAFCAVPTILAGLLDIPMGDADVSSLRVALCGAAPLPPALFNAFEAATGLRILEGYGMTEGCALSTVNPLEGERRIGSVGLPIPGHRVVPAIIGKDGAYVRDCEVEEVGELLLNGETVTPGYKSAAHDARAWAKPGWFNTGDLGRIDADGYVWLAGRAKDIIIRGGHNIDPAVIEEALSLHPAVELAAGIGQPDARVGEMPVAFVTLRPGLSATADELVAFARAHTSERAAAPSSVTILDVMPLTAVGKIFKPTLRERAAVHAVSIALGPDLLSRVRSIQGRHDDARGLVVTIRADRADADAICLGEAARLALVLEIVDQMAD